jgi:hypothetical protein
MPTLQTRPSAAARAGADVPSVIAATRLANAHAKSNELVILLTNLFFMIILLSIFFFCFGLF